MNKNTSGRRSRRFGDALHAIFFIHSVRKAYHTHFWLDVAVTVFFSVLILIRAAAPESTFIRFLWSWRGMSLQHGELQSEYLYRVSAMGLIISAICATAIVKCAHSVPGRWEDHLIFMGFFLFGLPTLAGMGVLGAIFCSIKASWLRLKGADFTMTGGS